MFGRQAVLKANRPPLLTDDHQDRSAIGNALSGVSEIGREFQVIALMKPEDPVGNLDIDIAGQDEEPLLASMARLPVDTGAGGEFDGEYLQVVRLIGATEKRVAVPPVFGSKVAGLSIADTDKMDVILTDLFAEQEGN
jgi:hypothetical protein